MLFCGEEDEVKGQLSEQHQESGKLETEDKVCIFISPSALTPPPLHTSTLTHGPQYHQKRICTRDDSINSTALSLSIDGYTEGPYSAAAAQSFVSMVTKQRKEKEESAKTEKVSCLYAEWSLKHVRTLLHVSR